MQDRVLKNGIYVSFEGVTLIRYRCHNGELYRLKDSTAEDEVISMMEYNTSTYEFICDYVSELSELEYGENFGEISYDQVRRVISKGLEIAEEVMVNDIILGELLYSDIIYSTNIFDDGSAGYFLALMNNVNAALQAPLFFRELVYKVLHKCEEYEDPQQWLEECVFAETELFSRIYQTEYINRDLETGEAKMSQVYFFACFDDYYSFMLINFAMQKNRVECCKCCGKFFVPKTKRHTIYCDRIITADGKTCKQAAPKLMQKFKKMNDPMLEEYERIKNRNYKRLERTEEKLPEQRKGKCLSFTDYSAWLDDAQAARIAYLKGEISADEFRAVLHQID